MPNQLNYPEKIKSTVQQRPGRINNIDISLIPSKNEQILFGTSDKDNVEVWAYNPDGTFAGHTLIRPTDTDLLLTTIVDQDGPHEILNVDMKRVALRMGLNPGRYTITLNLLRDEVGAEQSYKLQISKLSRDRTEVKLELVTEIEQGLRDIFEFIEPSAPKRFIQALVDEVFGVSLDAETGEVITDLSILQIFDVAGIRASEKIYYSDSITSFTRMVDNIRLKTRNLILDIMDVDVFNINIQETELVNYINLAVTQAVQEMILTGEIDPRFLVN